VSLASLTFILGPLVIGICTIWAFSVIVLGKRFNALVATKEAEKAQEAAAKTTAATPVMAKETATIQG
jgi:hypothetical protein